MPAKNDGGFLQLAAEKKRHLFWQASLLIFGLSYFVKALGGKKVGHSLLIVFSIAMLVLGIIQVNNYV